jgi:hypothetical protein
MSWWCDNVVTLCSGHSEYAFVNRLFTKYMAPHQPCAKYQYVLTSSTPKIVPVPDQEPKDEESPADYNVGGYMVIKIDDTFKDGRYIVARKLG